MSIDMAIWVLGLAVELVVIGVMIRERIVRLLPVFFAYMVWTLLSDVAGVVIRTNFSGHAYFQWFRVEMPLDVALQLAVIVELAWSVLRPIRQGLPRFTIPALAALILLLSAAIWPLAGLSGFGDLPRQWHTLAQFQQTAAGVRILFFLVLAGFSQLLAIGWRNRELQVATGLGIYSVASLGAAMLHAQLQGMAHYHLENQLVAATFLACLIYWAVSFVQAEAPRHEFSPRMQSLLLALAGTARTQRIGLEELQRTRKR